MKVGFSSGPEIIKELLAGLSQPPAPEGNSVELAFTRTPNELQVVFNYPCVDAGMPDATKLTILVQDKVRKKDISDVPPNGQYIVSLKLGTSRQLAVFRYEHNGKANARHFTLPAAYKEKDYELAKLDFQGPDSTDSNADVVKVSGAGKQIIPVRVGEELVKVWIKEGSQTHRPPYRFQS